MNMKNVTKSMVPNGTFSTTTYENIASEFRGGRNMKFNKKVWLWCKIIAQIYYTVIKDVDKFKMILQRPLKTHIVVIISMIFGSSD